MCKRFKISRHLTPLVRCHKDFIGEREKTGNKLGYFSFRSGNEYPCIFVGGLYSRGLNSRWAFIRLGLIFEVTHIPDFMVYIILDFWDIYVAETYVKLIEMAI